MPMCKILVQYDNKDGWTKGDIRDISNPTQLIKERKVVLLNEKGEEVAPSWVDLGCPICSYKAKNPVDLAHHILANHAGTPEDPPKTAETIKQQRLAALEKARAARKLKQLEENVKQKEVERDAALKEAVEATKIM